MNAPKRLTIKFFIDNPVVPDKIVPVFQRWIQQNKVEGLLIDVADYQHVYNGPGIILIGHEGDYAYDFADNRFGIQYTLKQATGLSLGEAISITLRRVLQAVHQLDSEVSLGNLQINRQEVQMIFRDRLTYPNNLDSQVEVISKVQSVLSENQAIDLSIRAENGDARQPLTLQVKSLADVSLADFVLGVAIQ